MIVEDIPVYNSQLLTKPFAFQYFRENTNPFGNVIAFVAKNEGPVARYRSQLALNFLWEIPVGDPFHGNAINSLFLGGVANTVASLLEAQITISEDSLVVAKAHRHLDVDHDRGLVTVNVASKSHNGTTIGHVGLHLIAGEDSHPLAFSLERFLQREQMQTVAQGGIESWHALIRNLFLLGRQSACV